MSERWKGQMPLFADPEFWKSFEERKEEELNAMRGQLCRKPTLVAVDGQIIKAVKVFVSQADPNYRRQ
jgi:hypothetical protein